MTGEGDTDSDSIEPVTWEVSMHTKRWSAQVGGLAALAFLIAAGAGFAVAARAQDAGVELSVERTLDATPEDMLRLAPGWVAEITSIVSSLELLDASTRRGRGDSNGLPCVIDDLESARALKASAASAQSGMESAIGTGSSSLASFEFRKIVVALIGARKLQTNAVGCAEGAGLQTGLTRRTVEAEGSGAGNEMAAVPDDIVDYGFDPFDASPF
jgi:hypothetical protein